MLKKRYVFDPANLQFRHHRLPLKKRFLHFALWFGLSVLVALVYNIIYNQFFESAKVLALTQDLEAVKLKYDLLNIKMNNTQTAINDIVLSDEKRYRPILKLDSISQSSRHPGTGGVERYTGVAGFENSPLLVKSLAKVEDLKNQVNAQSLSFREVESKAVEWKTMWEYLPYIRPVKEIVLGDKIGFRPKHPVKGEPAWHNGQDFRVPTGTEVFATGAGTVVECGWSSGGFGNYVVVDHGYGYKTTYGHLSRIDVSKGLNVKRGTRLGLSGSTGISTGPHLHYQIDLFGKHENPLSYLDTEMTEDEFSDMIETLSAGKY